jgi:hypothetical protein
VHHQTLRPDQVRVSIDKVMEEYREWSPPFSIGDGVDRLADLINSFLIWPVAYVKLLGQVFLYPHYKRIKPLITI